jgi:hypothetical protein
LAGLFFLVKEEETAATIHHLPAGLAAHCFFVSASAIHCWLVVDDSSSIRRKSPTLKGRFGLFVEKRF